MWAIVASMRVSSFQAGNVGIRLLVWVSDGEELSDICGVHSGLVEVRLVGDISDFGMTGVIGRDSFFYINCTRSE